MIERYTPITLLLQSGRLVRVDMLLVEPCFLPLDRSAYKGEDLPLLAQRPSFNGAEDSWFETGPVHFIIKDELLGSSQPSESVLVSVLLYSEPITAKEGFSELMLIFTAAWQRFRSVEEMLQEALIDVAWDDHAKDRPMHLRRDTRAIRVNFPDGAPHRGQIH